MESLGPDKPVKTFTTSQKSPANTTQMPKKVKSNVIVIKREVLTSKRAVELLLNGALASRVCRYCLHITSPLSSLDQIMQIADKGAFYKVTIRDIIASFHPYKVEDNPDFPNKICEKCLNKAIKSYLFSQQCEQSERALRNCFEDISEKFEKLDPLERTHKRGKKKQFPNHNVLYSEHRNVIDYAEPIRNLINVCSISLTGEPQMGDLECKKCWQILPNVESLTNHEKTHPKSMWFNCRLCGKSFAKKFHLKRHLRLHMKEKKPDVVERTDFICKQCGHTTENHDLHLQHIEKHKFQVVLEHLVERKMDKLCSVCFNKGEKMIEMDKMICLHGGYPELTGDRTLYNILGATVPELKNKYQELSTMQEAKIMSITKKNKNVAHDELKPQTKIYELSLPKVVSMEKISNGVYLFVFSDPFIFNEVVEEIDNDEMINKIIKLSENDIEEIYTEAEQDSKNTEQNNNEIEQSFNKAEEGSIVVSDNNDIVAKLDNMNATQFTFSKPDYISNSKTLSVDVSHENDETINVHANLCSKCWIFKKPTCENCTGQESNVTKSITQMNYDVKTECNTCQYCWIFKTVGKCDYCKETTEKGLEEVLTKPDHPKTNFMIGINNAKDSESAITLKRKLATEIPASPKKSKWKCSICLSTNNNRETCICCESKKEYEEATKLNINLFNFLPFQTTHEENVDVNQNKENNNYTKLSINIQENIKADDNTSIEMMDSSNSAPALLIDALPKPNDETMEICSEEEPTNIPNDQRNIPAEPIAMDLPNISCPIEPMTVLPNISCPNPLPFFAPATDRVSFNSDAFKNDSFKFSIGETGKENSKNKYVIKSIKAGIRGRKRF